MMKVCDLERTQTGLEATDESAKVLSRLRLGLQQTLGPSEGPVQSEFVHRGATESECEESRCRVQVKPRPPWRANTIPTAFLPFTCVVTPTGCAVLAVGGGAWLHW